MDGGKGRTVEKRDRRKIRISQRREDKPEIGLCYTLRHDLHIYINIKSA
jgi:hypothetical protein